MRGVGRLVALLARHGGRHGGVASTLGALEGAAASQTLRPSIAATQLGCRHFAGEGQRGDSGGPSKPKPPAAAKPQQQPRPQQQSGQSKPQAPQQPKAKAEEELDRPWHSGAEVSQLASIPAGKYFDVPRSQVCPEATKQYYQDPVLADERVNQPNYGCRAAQAELTAFGTGALLQRRCIQQLLATAEARWAAAADAAASSGSGSGSSSKKRRGGHIYLDGWTGSGKSVALFSLVSWARQNGWLAVYIPSAFVLLEGGTYFKGEDGLWDTPDAAKILLNAVNDNHGSLLKKLHGSNGQPLSKLVADGLAAKAPREVVEAAIKLKEELRSQTEVPVLFAVDDYNALYSHTGYLEAVHAFHQRKIMPDELRLAAAFRLLEQPAPANGLVVAAPTFGQTVSDKLRVPVPKGARLHVPRYALDEVAATAEYYSGLGRIAGVPDIDTLRRALFLTNGNAKELREYAATLLHEDDPLGISLGYKAKARRMTQYMETV